MIVERLSAATLVFHDPRARPGIGNGPVDDPVLEQLIEKILEPFGKTVPATAGGETADAVENLPDGDRGKAEALAFYRIEKGGDTWLRPRPHHLGYDVGVGQPRKRFGHSPSSPANVRGL